MTHNADWLTRRITTWFAANKINWISGRQLAEYILGEWASECSGEGELAEVMAQEVRHGL